MSKQRPSEWPMLFDTAIKILTHVEKTMGFAPNWTFGGGTALMLQIDHRESHDIDLFIDDPQYLPYLNPETQGMDLVKCPDGYRADALVLKLSYETAGEIDFICGAEITAEPTKNQVIRGHDTALEQPSEIIAKKVYYRGGMFQPRDMFDLAAVAEQLSVDYAVAALKQCGHGPCKLALEQVEKANPDFVRKLNSELMVRDRTRHLIETAQDISRQVLQQTV